MGTDRTWTLSRKHPFTTMFDGPKLELGETVSVVEESCLREAEAELEKVQWRAERVPDYIDAWNEAQARVERLEAELREAREALHAIDLRPGLSDLGMALTIAKDHGAGALPLVIDTMQSAHGQLREEQGRVDRARGVLEKGDKG
jgi:hypothetical protein